MRMKNSVDTINSDLRGWLISAIDSECLDKRDLIIGFVKFLSADEMVEFCLLNEIDINWLSIFSEEWETD